MAGMSGITRNNLQNYVINSNEALEFKLVRCAEDIENDNSTFKPDMSHQVYGDSEQIFGYSGLCVKLYYSACRLTTYLSHDFNDKIHPDMAEGVQPDEVIKPIAERIPSGYMTNLDDFIASLQKESTFRPYGEMTRRFTAVAENGDERTFEVYKCDANTPGFLQYHQRFQTFILWYIDAASYIDIDDEKWKFWVVYEKFQQAGVCQYGFAGYTSVYHYYAYPANIRPRISQMLVLPPFQNMGVGAEMLYTIYNCYQDDSSVLDITVEDPSDNFTRLRDYVDSKNCMKLECFQQDKLHDGFNDTMAEEAKKKYKLNKRQVRRVYEILKLRATNRADEEALKTFRLDVKSRLNIQYKKEDKYLEKLRKMLRPEEFAATMSTTTSKEQRIETLERQYECHYEHYMRVIERLDAES